MAPDFTLQNENGQKIELKDYRGNYIVLEWLNHGCPFVKKHYSSKNMQTTQKKVIDKNTKWFSIISSAKGKQGYSTPQKALADKKNVNSYASAILLDTDGKVGQAYQAKTTPHMFIIDPSGKVIYEGAIDSIASTDKEDIIKAQNYILEMFRKIKKGESLKVKKTHPYGCSVKY